MKNQNSTNVSRLTKKLLKMVENVNEKNETLDILIEMLESTNDPNPSELYLLESLYQLKEKILLTKSRIDNYLINERKETSLGNKLDNLYNSTRRTGTSVLFD